MTNAYGVERRGGEHRKGAAGDWRNQFLRAPYYRNYLTPAGIIADTFETAITWDRFDEFYAGVREQVGTLSRRSAAPNSLLSCRFTHIYPDGPAPISPTTAMGSTTGDMAATLDRWRQHQTRSQ